MTNENPRNDSKKAGENVWLAIQSQLAEGGGFLAAMLNSFRLFLKRQLLWFVIFAIVGSAAGAAYWYLLPKVYESEMTVSYVHYEKKIYADMLEKLDKLIQSNSYGSLAQLLELPEAEVEKIKGISSFNIRREPLIDDLSTEKIPFYIIVKVTDLEVLPVLQPAIVSYLDGTEFIQDRLAYMKKKSENELVFLERRLQTVDSLSKVLVIEEDKLSNEKKVTRMELLQETLTIYGRIQEVKGSLAFNLNIEVLDGFIADEKPAGNDLKYWLLLGGIIGIGVRFLVLIFSS